MNQAWTSFKLGRKLENPVSGSQKLDQRTDDKYNFKNLFLFWCQESPSLYSNFGSFEIMSQILKFPVSDITTWIAIPNFWQSVLESKTPNIVDPYNLWLYISYARLLANNWCKLNQVVSWNGKKKCLKSALLK